MSTYPFEFDPKQSFVQQASDWIGDVFYDILPEAGFEVRDEQIYMAFQLEQAYRKKETVFAEGGVGTGKTFVYLLYAILYARYTRKPAVIACADESLIEQLVKPEGDIAKLARHLDLVIDARLGKSHDQYICLNKLDEARGPGREDANLYREIYQGLPTFVRSPDTLQSFYPYGDRKDYPDMTDAQWSELGWDVFQDCLVCSQRHRCALTLSREHYRKSTDLIICSHDFYMEHIWTYEARQRSGQLPLLPAHSSVVFDEGHLLETAAQNALTYQLQHDVFEAIVTRLLEGEIRESFAYAVEDAIGQSEAVFALLDERSHPVPASDRREIEWDSTLIGEINRFREMIAEIEEQIVLESGLFTLDAYQLKIVEEHLEMIQLALGLFKEPKQLISWVKEDEDGITFVIMPKMVKEVLKERLFHQKMPIVFSSATLSIQGDFEHVASSLGIENYQSFSVSSPFDYSEQMKVNLIPDDPAVDKMKQTLQLLKQSEGGSLILFASREDLTQFQQAVGDYSESADFRFLFEGSAEISHLISQFQNDRDSILCAVSLWEGLDIPGEALSHVLMWSLPFPPNDPLFTAKRKEATDPFEQVDLPYMLLRLKQGIGRLIRTQEDRGIITIMGEELAREEVREKARLVLPEGTLIR
ncbi:ATP-dependent helicase [Ammoniphilus oxalaticus]|uniref:ATP-dependent helicase n=1 Tax=Ammoniphilus oxalaticus TaxID=66863 RepID=A0A419SNM6_9BACL|nr:ATP-dependent DNA helicase [Ammoniphilus oxalaticus]RKD25821.1 ATP-dependent helicase [Ammoniphilus oxalaticus]